MGTLPFLMLLTMAGSAPAFPPGSNWVAADAPPPAGAVVKNSIQILSDTETRWNATPVEDRNIRTYAGIVTQMRPVPLTVVLLRPEVSASRRDGMIGLLDEAGTCKGESRCVLVEQWTGPFKLDPPPAPPAPPAKG